MQTSLSECRVFMITNSSRVNKEYHQTLLVTNMCMDGAGPSGAIFRTIAWEAPAAFDILAPEETG